MSTLPAPHGKPAPHPASRWPRRRRSWGLCFILPTALLLLCLIAVAVSYILVASLLGAASQRNDNTPLGANRGVSSSDVATDFMQAIKSRSYLQAYNDLDDTLLVNLTADDFKSQAAHADDCYGSVSGFHLNSSMVSQGTVRYTYSVIRGRLSGQYPFQLTLQQSQGTWAITTFGNGNTFDPPGSPSCR